MCLVDEQVTDLLRAPAVGLTSAVKVAETHEKTEFPPIAVELIACAAQVRSGKCVGSTSRSEAGLKPGVRTRADPLLRHLSVRTKAAWTGGRTGGWTGKARTRLPDSNHDDPLCFPVLFLE